MEFQNTVQETADHVLQLPTKEMVLNFTFCLIKNKGNYHNDHENLQVLIAWGNLGEGFVLQVFANLLINRVKILGGPPQVPKHYKTLN